MLRFNLTQQLKNYNVQLTTSKLSAQRAKHIKHVLYVKSYESKMEKSGRGAVPIRDPLKDLLKATAQREQSYDSFISGTSLVSQCNTH